MSSILSDRVIQSESERVKWGHRRFELGGRALTNHGIMFLICSAMSPLSSTALKFTETPSNLRISVYTSSVPAGFPSPADDHIEGKLDLNEHLIRRPAATFFVRASGESMRDAGIFDGDLLIIDRSITPKSDHIVIASIHGELTVKRLLQSGDEWLLIPANPEFPVIRVDEVGCEIWGVVTHSIRRHCGR